MSTYSTRAPFDFANGPHGRLAFHRLPGRGPGVLWLGGFRSDMTGTKASFLAERARATGRAFLRFDYSGHGASAGRFEDGAISDWLADALYMLDRETEGPQILVGSSMGGWIAALLALARPERLHGIVFIAPAPDFTEELMLTGFTEAQRKALARDGRIEIASEYAPEPDVITRRLIEDGRRNLVLARAGEIACPVRLLHGMKDADVPWRHGMRLAEALGSSNLKVILTGSGDHRLSTPEDLQRLAAAIEELAALPAS